MSVPLGGVDLGFAGARVPPGTHACHVYTDDAERDAALLGFLSQGLRGGETAACFSENVREDELAAWLARDGVSLAQERDAGHFTLSSARAVYFENGTFDPDRMLALVSAFHDASVARGRSGVRVIGEMSAEILHVRGGSRLMEYEARVNGMLRDRPLTAVCQYDARVFGGATIMDVLSVHPMMVVHGAVVHNPFFVPPAELHAR